MNREKALSEVLGLFGGRPLPPGEGIERVPVRPAEFRQRPADFRVGRVARGQDNLPAGGTELARVGSRPVRLLCRHGAILPSTDHSNTPGPTSNRALMRPNLFQRLRFSPLERIYPK